MLIFVLIVNLFLSFLNFYIAFRLWKLRRRLERVTEAFSRLEGCIQQIFSPAPEIILQGQQNTHNLRESYRKLLLQLVPLEQMLLFISLARRML